MKTARWTSTPRPSARAGNRTPARAAVKPESTRRRNEPSVGTHAARHLLAVLGAIGVDTAAVRRASNLDAYPLDDLDARIPFRCAAAAWTEAVRRTGDEALGLHVAERLGRGALGALEYAVRHAASLGRALRQLTRYGRLTHDLARFELVEGKGEIHLTLDIPGSPTPTSAAQFFLAAPLALFRDCVAGGVSPREVHFVHADPGGGSAAEYGRVLGAPVRFGAIRHAIVFDAGQLALPFVEADAVLGRIVDQHLERALAALPVMATDSFPAQVRRVLADSLASAEPSAEVVATRLRVSVRTLNRRLAAEGESLRGLRDAVRHELAVAQLGDPRLAIGEVAFLLGFSESSAFYRWFRRVEGVSPGAFRRGRTATGPTPGEASRP